MPISFACLRQGSRMVELIAAVIITAGLRCSMVLQVLSCGSAAWSDSTACRKYSTPASLVPSWMPCSIAPQKGLDRVLSSTPYTGLSCALAGPARAAASSAALSPMVMVLMRMISSRSFFLSGTESPLLGGRRRSGGLPDLQGARQPHARDIAVHAGQPLLQQPPGFGGHLLDRLGDRADIGAQGGHPVGIIEAQQRDIVRERQIKGADRLDGAEGRDIGGGEDRGRPVGAAQLLLDRAAAAVDREAADHHARAVGKAGLAERVAIARDAIGDVGEAAVAHHQHDIGVAEGDQMLATADRKSVV